LLCLVRCPNGYVRNANAIAEQNTHGVDDVGLPNRHMPMRLVPRPSQRAGRPV
jgi:hypothetical protein